MSTATSARAKPATHVVIYRREPPDPWERAFFLFLAYVVGGLMYLFQLL